METSTSILILQHPTEARRKHTGTATVLPLCLSKCEVIRGDTFGISDLPSVQQSLQRGMRPLLLFPHPSARILSRKNNEEDTSPSTCGENQNRIHSDTNTNARRNLLIAIDGTWRQAKHMLRHSQELVDACEWVHLADGDGVQIEFDSLRREPATHCTSTAESVAAALARIEDSEAATKASHYIQCAVKEMVKAQLEHCKAAPPRKDSSSLRSIRRSLHNPNVNENAFERISDIVAEDIIYHRMDPLAAPLISKFYRKNKYRATAKRCDIIWEARSLETNEIVGAVRLVRKTSIDDVVCIRNLFVVKKYRRRGIGQSLMQAALAASTNEEYSRCYCFLRQELEPIYRAAGLEVIDSESVSLSKWIREEYAKVQKQQDGQLIIMGRGF